VLQQTIAEAALDEDARRMGLGQSDGEVMRTIYNDPNFKGLGGNFRSGAFPGHDPPIRLHRTALPRRTAARGLAAPDRRHHLAGLEPPKLLIDALTRFQNEQRSVDYIKLDAAQPAPSTPPRPRRLRLFRRPQDPVPRARISQTVIRRGQSEEISNGPRSRTKMPRRCSSSAVTGSVRREARSAQIVFPNAAEAEDRA